jgi:hypothetical protein
VSFLKRQRAKSRTCCDTARLRRHDELDHATINARAQGQTSGPSQLFLSLQFVQHTHLLCGSLSPGPAWNGNSGRFPALSRSLARESLPAQDVDGRYAQRSQLVMTYFVAPRLSEGEVCPTDNPATCGEVGELSRIILSDRRPFRVADSSSQAWLGSLLERMDR